MEKFQMSYFTEKSHRLAAIQLDIDTGGDIRWYELQEGFVQREMIGWRTSDENGSPLLTLDEHYRLYRRAISLLEYLATKKSDCGLNIP